MLQFQQYIDSYILFTLAKKHNLLEAIYASLIGSKITVPYYFYIARLNKNMHVIQIAFFAKNVTKYGKKYKFLQL